MLRNITASIILCLALACARADAALAGQGNGNLADLPESMRYMEIPDNDFERGAVLKLGKENTAALYKHGETSAREVVRPDHGLVLPQSDGTLVIIPGEPTAQPDTNYVDARELKLKMRELAAQLVAGLDQTLSSHIALPTSFVLQDDFERTSSFGRFISEQMYYEFNQRGLPTGEYRLADQISRREDGEFLLARGLGSKKLSPDALYLTGTYYTDNHTIMVNARLLKADGQVLRTGQVIFSSSPLVRRMLASSGKKLPVGSLELLDFAMEARPPSQTTAFDQGLDIH